MELDIRQAMPSLKETFRKHFKVGAAVSTRILEAQGDFIAGHFSSVTAENEMKPEEIHPEEERYDFAAADRIIDWAGKNGIAVRGHTLVWHNQVPAWMFLEKDGTPVARERLLERMREHIRTVVGRYKGRAYAWDVVNEAVDDKTDRALRPSPWLDIIGPDFIQAAFEAAHEADPEALLFYNDYNETDPVKREKIYELLRSLLEQGAPIHGVGLQAHWNIYEPSLAEIREAIERYASLGLRLHITELDLSMYRFEDRRNDLDFPSVEMMSLQRQRYEEIFGLFREYADVIDSVTFWGVADDYTWLDYFPVRGRKNWPFLFDEKLRPKASFWSVTDAARTGTKGEEDE
ncbi:endo-1,4-beta-xylanase [Paenibacillus spiritus]|uniref:Beta-xylanase n=1 Tax=Paenibacillus spiritus TaxID=2496557 RepID=A0A5J5GB50_9BACL|nr:MULTISPECIES: endo-1,4-beta-xylanase [Paenibacillus]KAA9005335.1 endo-1,4-beta-xylanase [Paenibacillus spiritus]